MTHRCKPWEDEVGALVALRKMEQLPSLTAPEQAMSMGPRRDRRAHLLSLS